MKLPNWFKIVWWLLLLIGVGLLLTMRISAIAAGQGGAIDALLLVLWVALFLAPVYQEVDILGLKLKQEVREVKDAVEDLRAEIRNSVDVRAQINPTFNFPTPPPDSQLPALEIRLRKVLEDVLQSHGREQVAVDASKDDVSNDVLMLFNARYQVEKEVRRIWENRVASESRERRNMPVYQMLRTLSSEGHLDSRIVGVIREVYAVSSPAIHGEPVTQAQVAFVKDVTPQLISTLRAIEF